VKRTILALASILSSSAVRAQAPNDSASHGPAPTTSSSEYRFADIAWGSPADTVKAALQREGIAFITTDSLGDLTFAGAIFQRKAAVIASMIDGRLARTVVGFEKMSRSTLPLYRAIKRELIAKYGKPTKSTEVFLPPYYEGDGNEEGAFLTKKAVFLSRWRSAQTGERLSLLIDERPGVMVVYESAAWPNDAARKPKSRRN
jgi:hypothetical protein